ncbi:MAG TPA: hypothetical protein VK911_16955 [Vicinamibacterales bacterium]|nr:hypothetical protein [Vicinamibacterales bacterium]
MFRTNFLAAGFVAALGTAVLLGVQAPPSPQPPPQQPPRPTQDIALTITGEPGTLARYAVPDFIAASPDPDTVAAARLMAQVLWDDLAFEREFDMIPRDTYQSIPAARSFADVPFERWRELGADGLVIGLVRRAGTDFEVEMRLLRVAAGDAALAKQYTGASGNPRLFAHTIADDIHQNQVALRGVARTRLSFSSDRDGERLGDTVEERTVKEIYIADYDGANPRRVTTNRRLNISPKWSPDARAIAYTSYRRNIPDLFISNIYQGTLENPTKGRGQNFLPAWSPDGARLAFMSDRDGNPEIYVMNRDGSGVRRLTNHPMNDVTPTWSPAGTHIAFTSDRSGSPQIYVVAADGTGTRRITAESYCDRPTWSPAPFNEIAYASRTGSGFDVKVIDLSSSERRQLTFGQGAVNESPVFAPNGRHIAFTSNRTGKQQIWTIDRLGRNLRQITKVGNNTMPDWSH